MRLLVVLGCSLILVTAGATITIGVLTDRLEDLHFQLDDANQALAKLTKADTNLKEADERLKSACAQVVKDNIDLVVKCSKKSARRSRPAIEWQILPDSFSQPRGYCKPGQLCASISHDSEVAGQ